MLTRLMASNNVRITCGIRTWKNKVVAKLKIAPFKRFTFKEEVIYKVNMFFSSFWIRIGQEFPALKAEVGGKKNIGSGCM